MKNLNQKSIRKINRITRNTTFSGSKKYGFSHNIQSKKAISLGVLGLTVLLYFAVSHFLPAVQARDGKSTDTITSIEDCRRFEINPVSSVLIIDSTDSNVKKVQIASLRQQEILYTDITKTVFQIDKSGTTGTFQDYLDSTGFYLNEVSFVKNLQNVIVNNFKIQIDYVIWGQNADIKKYTKDTPVKEASNKIIAMTNLCQEDYTAFVQAISKSSVQNVAYPQDLNETYVNQIRKEQVRVHVQNKTGVEEMGKTVKQTLENYGLQVVKVDYSAKTTEKSTIYTDSTRVRNSLSIDVLKYVLQNRYEQIEIKEGKSTVFGDVYVEVGLDYLQ